MSLLVPAYPGCPGSKAVKRSLLLLLSVIYRCASSCGAYCCRTERAEMNRVRLHVRALHFRLAVPHTTIDLNLTPTFIRLIYAVVARQLKGEWPAFSVRVEKPNDHIKRGGE